MNSPANDPASVTQLLRRINDGDPAAADDLLPLVYEQLRGLADRVAGRGGPPTLQATALVHEAYIRMLGPSEGRAEWVGSRHFFAVAAMAMRSLLADHARRAMALKNGGGYRRVTFDEGLEDAQAREAEIDLLDLHEVLTSLEEARPSVAKVVELRFIGGLTMTEVSAELGITERMAFKHWRAGRALLAERFLGRSA
ncbi:MAG: ECF-type sigma factor [Planctomycetota bacterium]